MYPQVFGKYVLERELARGGMARVVLATLRGAGGFEKKLVVKQIRDELASDDDFVRRFVLEAKTTVQLAHPNIVPVYELGVELGTYFLAMEFVEGASLAELLRANPRPVDVPATDAPTGARTGLSPAEGAYVGVEVCRALDYAHRRMNVVHGDVTPRNVMVDEEGQIKVIDFGIAAPVATTPSGHGVFGSPGHMPPEQMDARELTPAADVFAVAVLLMELWSGRAPFRRHTREAIEAAMRAPHPKPSDVDPRLLPLDDVIASAMSLDPGARPQQADVLSRELRRFLAGIDLGDLARHLGDRVRDVRVHPVPPPSEPRAILQRPPSRPTATQVGTKTFAARADVTRPAPLSPSPSEAVVRIPAHPSFGSSFPSPEISTRRMESRPPGASVRASRAPRRPRRGVALLGGVGAGVLAVAAFFLGRANTNESATGPGVTTATSTAAPVTSLQTSTVSSGTSASTGAGGARSAVPAGAAPSLAPSASSAAAPPRGSERAPESPAERAQLVLLGDGTFVSVDGVTRGACPARVSLEPGAHTVVFAFPPTGEAKSESLTLRGGERATLHADFTGTVPAIHREQR